VLAALDAAGIRAPLAAEPGGSPRSG